jgi:RNA polymerase sigma factor (sigma-70 family)
MGFPEHAVRRQRKAISKSEIWDLLGARRDAPTRTRLVRAYESLTPKQQDALLLRIRGLTQKEIADLMDRSPQAVSRLLARANDRLAAALA